MNSFIAYSARQDVKSWGWRHLLAWRQLSAFWQIQIEQHVLEHLPATPGPTCAYSLALAPQEFADPSALQNHLNAAPTVLFLNRVKLCLDQSVSIDVQEDQTPPGSYQHSFKVNPKSHLTVGLPEHLATYGPLSEITPLSNDNDLQILVWLDGVPVIGYHAPHLLIGADPWQLGNPTVPLVYPILMNWLRSVVGVEVHVAKPYAAIRLDDWPSTAEALLHNPPTPAFDRQRAATLKRLRKYALRHHVPQTLMYSSHYYSPDGSLESIADSMPHSIREMRLGMEQKVFEIGAHGMMHLRYPHSQALQDADPREFLDLDEEGTKAHLSTCTQEIQNIFNVRPESFVTPAWGYRPGVTKRIAGQQFKIVIDSSQHIEDGTAEIFSASGEEYPAFNGAETFRPGSRMLSFTSPAFWKCYAIAGIPVHYMQHTDANWHLLREFLGSQTQSAHLTKVKQYMQDVNTSLGKRLFAAVFLLINAIWNEPTSLIYLWKLLLANSFYEIVNAMCWAGYQCVGLQNLRHAFHRSIINESR